MKILVTGANGMVAKAAINHCHSIGDEVIGKTRQELDIAEEKQVFTLFERERFDAVLNCAAYTNVDGAETEDEINSKANTEGVENLAAAAKKINSAFVTISTDYVFDGTKGGFYTQRDTPNPQGAYAKAKLAGEMAARNIYSRSIIVRSGWIFGTDGTNFLSVMHKLLGAGNQSRQFPILTARRLCQRSGKTLASTSRTRFAGNLPCGKSRRRNNICRIC